MILPVRAEKASPELRILLEHCCARPDPGQAPADALDDPELRRRFLELSVRNRVAGLVLASLDRTGVLDNVSQETAHELRGALAALRRRATVWLLERDRMLAHLSRGKLEPVVLKGAALCSTVYQEPVERSFGDLDLLFLPESAEEAIGLIESLGYAPEGTAAWKAAYLEHHIHLPLHHPGGFIAEIHWGLSRATEPHHLDATRVMTESREVVGLRMPRDEHLILHAVAQSSEDAFPSLVRAVDLDRIVRHAPTMDWDRVAFEGRTAGLQNVLTLLVGTARRILDTPIPAEALRRGRPGPIAHYHLGLLEVEDTIVSPRLTKSWTVGTFFAFWMRPRLGDRLRYLARRIRGGHDPMDWVWRERKQLRKAEQTATPAPLASAFKLVAFQALLYARRLGWLR